MKRILSARGGETLVEVMCAGAVLLIALGTLLGAVRFSASARRRAENMGAALAELRGSLLEVEAVPGEAADYVFTDPESGAVLFTVTAAAGTRQGRYTAGDGTGETAEFAVFLPAEDTP